MAEFDTVYKAPGVTVVRERIDWEELAKAAVRCGNIYLLKRMHRPPAQVELARHINRYLKVRSPSRLIG